MQFLIHTGMIQLSAQIGLLGDVAESFQDGEIKPAISVVEAQLAQTGQCPLPVVLPA